MSETTTEGNVTSEFTDEEKSRIQNELTKPKEPEEYCPSPQEIREHVKMMIDSLSRLATCPHPRPERIGPHSYCGECGAISRGLPSYSNGMPGGDGKWERPGILKRTTGE